MAPHSLLSAAVASAVVGLSFNSAFESVIDAFYLLQWQLPVLPVVCIVLGVLTARKTHRSTFNWVLVGLFAGVIPVVGPVLMVVAYFWYPPPPPTRRAGYHPPGSGAARTKPAAGAARTKPGQRRPRTGPASPPAGREAAGTPPRGVTDEGPREAADAARRADADDRP